MKITMKTEIAKKLFDTVSKCIVDEKIAPIRNMYWKNNNDGTIYVKAMDRTHVLETSVEIIDSEDFNDIYIPFFEINSFISKFRNETTKFEVNENILKVSSGRPSGKVALKNIDESNSVSEMLGENFIYDFNMNKKHFNNVKTKLTNLVATDNNRPVLTGICLDIINGSIYFASSDGKRLGVYDTQTNTNDETQNVKIAIPVSVFNSLICLDNGEDINVKFSDKFIKFSDGKTNYYATLINGEYPAYQNIVNASSGNNIEISVNRSKLNDSLQFVNLKYEVNKKCDLTIKNNLFILDVNNNESYDEFDVEFDGEISVSLNSSLLEKMTKPLESENIIFKFADNQKPILIEADNMKLLLMPIKTR